MKRSIASAGSCVASLMLLGSLLAGPAEARHLGVDLWTDRGNDAIYEPGDVLQVRTRTTDDAYLLVYEIDSQGYVRVLYPLRGQNGMVAARETYRVPSESDDQQLVVQDPIGEDYIVAIATREPFEDLPWYLRPYDVQGDDIGYVNEPTDEEGVTRDGKVVGDPFVAMERIRRRVVPRPNDTESFATAYTTYYVHQQVRYPRYICNDCHRPGQWAWWDGWDPYYTSCRVVDFRVNWSWGWGPSYWCGFVPYYVFVYRPDCLSRWRVGSSPWLSSWDGWRRWTQNWGGPLVRYKSPPPIGYTPPEHYKDWRGGTTPPPPGFVVSGVRRGGIASLPIGRNRPADPERTPRRPEVTREPVERVPASEDNGNGRRERGGVERRRPDVGRMPAGRPNNDGEGQGRSGRDAPPPRNDRPYEPRIERRPVERPPAERPDPPHQERGRDDRPHDNGHARDEGRAERPHDGGAKPAPPPRDDHEDRGRRGGP